VQRLITAVLETANADIIRQKEYAETCIQDEFTSVSTQLEMQSSETLDLSKAATIAQVGEMLNTEIINKKAAVLDEFERMVSAATT